MINKVLWVCNLNKPLSEFNEFKSRFNSSKNLFELSTGLNLEKLNTIPYLSPGLNLSRGSNSLNSPQNCIQIAHLQCLQILLMEFKNRCFIGFFFGLNNYYELGSQISQTGQETLILSLFQFARCVGTLCRHDFQCRVRIAKY